MEKLQLIGERMLAFLSDLISFGNTYIGTYLLIILLLIAGFYFTFKTQFVQFRMIKEMIKLLGDGVGKSQKDGKVSLSKPFVLVLPHVLEQEILQELP